MKNACEICHEHHIVTDTHHIQSKSRKGNNRLKNRCEVCPNCHRKIHMGDIIIEGRFSTTNCELNETELIWRRKGEESITGVKDPDVWTY